ncbi:hypothetical protein B0H63DRAFT_537510 [Podospora didyma]|uniref:Uncharacterized protein n=1 Tax=Podospora didyma TaxID=330526 RepID=A0AAE0U3R0_9PEZI|nr:hypothetical protein B0H63DRAFT_537510 [Podospora didyma]
MSIPMENQAFPGAYDEFADAEADWGSISMVYHAEAVENLVFVARPETMPGAYEADSHPDDELGDWNVDLQMQDGLDFDSDGHLINAEDYLSDSSLSWSEFSTLAADNDDEDSGDNGDIEEEEDEEGDDEDEDWANNDSDVEASDETEEDASDDNEQEASNEHKGISDDQQGTHDRDLSTHIEENHIEENEEENDDGEYLTEQDLAWIEYIIKEHGQNVTQHGKDMMKETLMDFCEAMDAFRTSISTQSAMTLYHAEMNALVDGATATFRERMQDLDKQMESPLFPLRLLWFCWAEAPARALWLGLQVAVLPIHPLFTDQLMGQICLWHTEYETYVELKKIIASNRA